MIENKNNISQIPKGRLAPNFIKRVQRKLNRMRVDFYKKRNETDFLIAVIITVKSLISQIFKIIFQKIKSFFSGRNKFPELSKEELIIFEHLKDKLNIVFDVGVRDDLFFYNIKKDCSYHLFEPNKNFTKLLKEKISKFDNHNIALNEYGLGEKNEDDCVYYEKSQSFEINPYMVEDRESGNKYSVRTLDGYVEENKIPHIDFLKIDAEGFDYKIMLGGIDTIEKNKISYIQFEYWTGVKKFVDLLGGNYDLYLIMEPVLFKAIKEKIYPKMSEKQKNKDYSRLLIKLDEELIKLIDEKLAPIGLGGNIFGINKNIKNIELDNLFKINITNTIA